ncbi:MAG: UDP-N-acetylmuramoyl-L-alanine--D-glutamate ligase [Granulosicoccus sp.]
MKIADLKQKAVLVVGLGVTGISVAGFLARQGVDFSIADEKASESTLADINVRMPLHKTFTGELFCQFDVIVLSPGIPRAHPAIAAAVASGVEVIGDIELFASAVTVPVVAVTGSNGKSTVVAWLADALNVCGTNAIACGNIGDAALDALQSDAEVLVLELSSYQLESTSSLRPLSAVVLNVSDDHRDRYDSIEHYASVKRRVYKNAHHCVANRDDLRTWPSDDDVAVCSFFTLAEQVMADTDTAGRTWQRSILNKTKLSMPGDHNVANALAIVALAAPLIDSLAIEENALLASLENFTGLAHRSQFVGERDGVRWYNDSKGTNVDACQKAVLAMPGPVILIAGGISKGADFSTLSETVNNSVKLLILMGQDRQIIASQLKGCVAMELADTLLEAVRLASDKAGEGDVVLLSPACSSFDMFDNFEDRGEQFVAAVQEVLAA